MFHVLVSGHYSAPEVTPSAVKGTKILARHAGELHPSFVGSFSSLFFVRQWFWRRVVEEVGWVQGEKKGSGQAWQAKNAGIKRGAGAERVHRARQGFDRGKLFATEGLGLL